MSKIIGQEEFENEIRRIFNIFKRTKADIKPHFIVVGESGSGKTYSITNLCEEIGINFIEINAAQITKEGTAGNSLSKALAPISNFKGLPTICLMDEFDKLFISGNTNDTAANEVTVGVQNELLKILESKSTATFGDYGKYNETDISKVLFVFAGAFNGEKMDLDKLRKVGVKNEFLGRVGLVYNTKKLNLEDLYKILEQSTLLNQYYTLFNFDEKKKKETIKLLKEAIKENYEKNILGARYINTLIHQYFIKGEKYITQEKKSKEIKYENSLEF